MKGAGGFYSTKHPTQHPLVLPTVGRLGQPHDGDGQYIGRGQGSLPHSPFANPFKLTVDTEANRLAVLGRFAVHVLTSFELCGMLHTLAGKHLLCYCHPKPCHGHVCRDLVARVLFHGSRCPECNGKTKNFLGYSKPLTTIFESWVCQNFECGARGLAERPPLSIALPAV